MSAEHSFSLVESDQWYAGLDDGIRFPVRVLHARGVETGQSCQGGEGHSYDWPSIDLLAGSDSRDGFTALGVLEGYGLRVRDVALMWTVTNGLASESFWRITLWQAWPERADRETDVRVGIQSDGRVIAVSLSAAGHRQAGMSAAEPRPMYGIRDDFPLLFAKSAEYDMAERLGGCADPLLAEIDAALRELWDARRFVSGSEQIARADTGRQG